ncbi:putative regulator of chromosome condensation 1/beta-lactamase-inhibitor protein II [Helianthus annuus]|uniref:Regulator of chromosome condensation 1/beta-lactamase-inhibitor protein II n=1 Tax=Helianthus annuus TaxID=4232 RepID=A0A251V911_HELAN|nr:putative regulator of chromosome condensation 1/beta-lactamase-inhibitor protein II [Helianthus annuus]
MHNVLLIKKNTVSLSLGFQISHLIPIRLPLSLSLSAIQKPQALSLGDSETPSIPTTRQSSVFQTCAAFVNDGGCGWKMMTLVGGQIDLRKIFRSVSHTVVATEDGLSFSFGWNKHGQLGTGSTKTEFELDPVRCLVTEVTKVACGADFTVWLTSDEELLDFHSMVNLDMDLTWSIILKIALLPAAISSFADETIVNMACGSNHTVAVESKGYVYT